MKTSCFLLIGSALLALGLGRAAAQQLVGSLTVQKNVALTGVITPAQITASQNDYAPTGIATASTLRISSDAAWNITGLAAGLDGEFKFIDNVGSFPITFVAESASSTTTNRFAIPSNFTLPAGRGIMLKYDPTSDRWRILGGAGDLDDNIVTDAKLRDSAGLSVIGRASNSTGDPADIVAASDHQVLRRSGTALGFGSINLASTAAVTGTLVAANGGTGQSSYTIGDLLYASSSSALSKLADVATGNVLISGGVGAAPSYGKVGLTTHVSGTLPVANGGTGATTLTGVLKGNGTSAFTAAVAGTDYVAPGAVTTSGLTMSTSRILGRTTAATGAIEELTAANVLSFIGLQSGATSLSASDETKTIMFATAYGSAPTSVTCTIETPTGGYVVTANVRDITTTQFTAVFGAAIPATGYKLHWKALP